MPFKFKALGSELFTALIDPNSRKREALINGWVKNTVAAMQSVVPKRVENMVKPQRKWRDVGIGLASYGLLTYLYIKRSTRNHDASDDSKRVGEELSGFANGSFAEEANPQPSTNDQRSNVMNPNNPAYNAAVDNRSNQMNPNNSAYHSSRGSRGG